MTALERTNNGKSALSFGWGRIMIALAIALISDGISFFGSAVIVALPLIIGIDLVTGFLIWLALGRPMVLFAVFMAEAIPGVAMIPLWTLIVVALAVTGRLPSRITQSQPSAPSTPANHPAPTRSDRADEVSPRDS